MEASLAVWTRWREHTTQKERRWERWVVAGGAVQCSDWSDVDSGQQISRQVASKQHSQQKQRHQDKFFF